MNIYLRVINYNFFLGFFFLVLRIDLIFLFKGNVFRGEGIRDREEFSGIGVFGFSFFRYSVLV